MEVCPNYHIYGPHTIRCITQSTWAKEACLKLMCVWVKLDIGNIFGICGLESIRIIWELREAFAMRTIQLLKYNLLRSPNLLIWYVVMLKERSFRCFQGSRATLPVVDYILFLVTAQIPYRIVL